MFVLLRHLQKLRRVVALDRPVVGSCALRHVDAGSCNGCEHEINAAAGPYYDLQRFGLNIVASPRHADVLLITGPVTTRMQVPLMRAYEAMPEPRLVAALGDCALGTNIIGLANEHMGGVGAVLPVDIEIPGCPPTPETIAGCLLDGLKMVREHAGTVGHVRQPTHDEGALPLWRTIPTTHGVIEEKTQADNDGHLNER
jgi:Ni,Fe-hydrogenase III small subunit